MMRLITAILVAIGGLVLADVGHAQNNAPSSQEQRPLIQAPVGHRQPRPSDIQGGQTTTPSQDSSMTNSTTTTGQGENDERLNRAINGICRGC